MPTPQPVEVKKVSDLSSAGKRPSRVPHASREIGDQIFKYAMLLCGFAVLGTLVLIVYELVLRSGPSWHAFGFKFFAGHDWDPVNEQFGAMPFIYGTLLSSLLALLIAVPLSVGVAVFTTEMCPKALRNPLSFFVELLAAIPSVVYGLWAIFVLVPILSNYVEPFLSKTLGWTGFFTGAPYGISMLAAGIILAIMIVPIISSITREVLMVVPQHQREAARDSKHSERDDEWRDRASGDEETVERTGKRAHREAAKHSNPPRQIEVGGQHGAGDA